MNLFHILDHKQRYNAGNFKSPLVPYCLESIQLNNEETFKAAQPS